MANEVCFFSENLWGTKRRNFAEEGVSEDIAKTENRLTKIAFKNLYHKPRTLFTHN